MFYNPPLSLSIVVSWVPRFLSPTPQEIVVARIAVHFLSLSDTVLVQFLRFSTTSCLGRYPQGGRTASQYKTFLYTFFLGLLMLLGLIVLVVLWYLKQMFLFYILFSFSSCAWERETDGQNASRSLTEWQMHV